MLKKASIPINIHISGLKNKASALFIDACNDNFIPEAAVNPGQFTDKIKSNIKFINKELPIIPLNVVHPVFSIDLVGKLITGFLGLLEIATINIKAIKEVGASIDNKYSSINYNIIHSNCIEGFLGCVSRR